MPLPEAAKLLGADPRAIQLRDLQTLTEIAGEKTATIVFPLPMDLVEPIWPGSRKSGAAGRFRT